MFLPLVIICLFFDKFVLAAIIFLILSITDFFDGYLARKMNQITDFGKLMDPMADKILVIATLIVLVEKGMAQSLPVIIISSREIFITGWRAHVGASGIIIAASPAGKIKTVVQIIAVLMLIISFPLGVIALWLAAILSIYSGVEYIGKRS